MTHAEARPPRDPNPAPGTKLRDMLIAAEQAPFLLESMANTIGTLTGTPPNQDHLRHAKALDALRMLLEHMMEEWPAHKAILTKSKFRRKP